LLFVHLADEVRVVFERFFLCWAMNSPQEICSLSASRYRRACASFLANAQLGGEHGREFSCFAVLPVHWTHPFCP